MLHARSAHTSTLLKDGTVLIAGGFEAWPTPVADAELFDPATGVFTVAGSMVAPRIWHSAVLLEDGRVLIVGGYSKPKNVPVDLLQEPMAEIYDPATRVFTPAGTLAQPRYQAFAVTTPDGGAVVLGGRCTSRSEGFDASTRSFRDIGFSNFFQEIGSSPVFVGPGQIVMAGGGYCSGRGDFSVADISVSDDYGKTFVNIGHLNDSRMWHTTTTLGRDKLLVAGGFARDFNPSFRSGTLDSAEIVDAATGLSRRVGSLHEARAGHSAAPLATGEVLIAGGGVATTEIFDPSTETFHVAGSLVVPRSGAPMIVTKDQRVFLFGGSNGSGSLSSVEEFVAGASRRRAVI